MYIYKKYIAYYSSASTAPLIEKYRVMAENTANHPVDVLFIINQNQNSKSREIKCKSFLCFFFFSSSS